LGKGRQSLISTLERERAAHTLHDDGRKIRSGVTGTEEEGEGGENHEVDELVGEEEHAKRDLDGDEGP
jgi:hypothetical protein